MPRKRIKLAVLQARRDACRACEFAVSPSSGWVDRKFWCGKLFDGNQGHRYQRAYLPIFIESCEACPAGVFPACGPDDVGEGETYPYEANDLYHALWAEIHNPERQWSPQWWNSIILRMPPNCACRAHATSYADEHPIPYGDDAVCWEWGIAFHNAVNARLGKPLMPLVEARERYPSGG